MKKINHYISALIVAAMTAGFASCSSSDEPSSVSDNTPKELTLTIMSTKPATKAALEGSSAPTDAQENTINRITVGIFNSTGTEVRTIQEFDDEVSSTTGIEGTNKFYNDGNGAATVKVVTTKMVNNDIVAVAINAPSNTFKGVQKLDDFKAKTISADLAIATNKDGNQQTSPQAANIPMYGQATATGSSTDFTASVNVYHLTAKITLSSLSVAFDANGPYADASFTPTEIFLYNVPEGLKFNYNDPYLSSPTYYTGESGATGTVKDYLSTGDFTATATPLNASNQTFSTTYYFYTTPNNDVNTNKTKLVIKGNFKKNSSDVTGTNVYYPVKLNWEVKSDGTSNVPSTGGDAYKVYPNKDYQCSVVIKTIGSDGPDKDIDPMTATIDITVKNWDPISQTTVFQ